LQTLLGIEFPIIQAPKPGVQGHALAASNATPVSRRRLPKPMSASRPWVPAIECPLWVDNGLIEVAIADVHANDGSRRMNSAAAGHERSSRCSGRAFANRWIAVVGCSETNLRFRCVPACRIFKERTLRVAIGAHREPSTARVQSCAGKSRHFDLGYERPWAFEQRLHFR